MNDTSSPLRATNATGVFSRVDFATDPNAQWPLESVVALWIAMPFLPKRSTTTFGSGVPSLIDMRKTSWLPSAFFFVRIPVSVTRMKRESLTALTAFFFSESQPRAVTKNRPRSLAPSADLRRCSENSNAE